MTENAAINAKWTVRVGVTSQGTVEARRCPSRRLRTTRGQVVAALSPNPQARDGLTRALPSRIVISLPRTGEWQHSDIKSPFVDLRV